MRDEVSIAGVPWPVYKLLALAVGFIVLVIVGFATTSAGASVLAAAAAATVVWLGLGAFRSPTSPRPTFQRCQICGDRVGVGIELLVRHSRPSPHGEQHLAARLVDPAGTTRSGLYTASPDGRRTT